MSTGMSPRASTLPASDTRAFVPSALAIRQHYVRLDADRIINEFINDFSRKEFFPAGGQSLLFAMLTQLPQWSADTCIQVVSQDGSLIASYSKGIDPAAISRNVVLVLDDEGGYVVADEALASAPEALFRLIFSQLGAGALLGEGGNFPGSNSIAGRIATVREQIGGLAADHRPLLFDALLADATETRNAPQAVSPNPFLPFALRQPTGRTDVLEELCALFVQAPVEHLEQLLGSMPLTKAEEEEFLATLALPDAFLEALDTSLEEARRIRAIDGIIHPRSYDPDTDLLARELTGKLLLDRLQRELAIVEPGQGGYQPTGDDDNHVVLWHVGQGNYLPEDLRNGINAISQVGSESFYRAISSLLQPHERQLLGLTHELDLAGFRRVIATVAIERNGGWFEPDVDTQKKEPLPDWLENSTDADKVLWNQALRAYSQSLLEAQAPGFIDVAAYGTPGTLRNYTRDQLVERINIDHGLAVNPDEVFIKVTHRQWTGYVTPGLNFTPGETTITVERRSLTEACLNNIGATEIYLRLTAKIVDKDDREIPQLTIGYIYYLIRDLNVGEHYAAFLQTRLLTSSSAQWHREHYARVMQAQMRMDAIEAKMAGGFKPDRADRGYRWAQAVIEHPVDDASRPAVEGHRIEVRQLRVNGVLLHGLLFVGSASRLSISSVVMFSPLAPDGIAVRELGDIDELQSAYLYNPVFLDYLVNMASVALQPSLRHALTARQYEPFIEFETVEGDFFHAAYEHEVSRVIAAVDQQTTTTWEANWHSVWEITKAIGSLALEFAPFRVRLPLAALRSLYALSQGVQGGSDAPLHFTRAILLLADGLPTLNAVKVRSASGRPALTSTIPAKTAVASVPDGLKMRTDGVFNGVYEKAGPGAQSSFYIRHDGRAHLVRYDTGFSTWRLIDPRRPDAYYQLPLRFSENSGWTRNSIGLPGGKPGRRAKDKLAQANGTNPPATGEGGAGVSVGTTSGGRKRYKVDMTGFEMDSEYLKADPHIQIHLKATAERVVLDYQQRGRGNFHGLKGKNNKGTFTLDLDGIPGSRGRGAWRMKLRQGDKGVIVFDEILSDH